LTARGNPKKGRVREEATGKENGKEKWKKTCSASMQDRNQALHGGGKEPRERRCSN